MAGEKKIAKGTEKLSKPLKVSRRRLCEQDNHDMNIICAMNFISMLKVSRMIESMIW